jgi:hypothetical protein
MLLSFDTCFEGDDIPFLGRAFIWEGCGFGKFCFVMNFLGSNNGFVLLWILIFNFGFTLGVVLLILLITCLEYSFDL